jgi:hypothetical protein
MAVAVKAAARALALLQTGDRCKLEFGNVTGQVSTPRWHLALNRRKHLNEEIMKSSAWLFIAAMSISGMALAQSTQGSGVTEITDPAKISAIQQHAQELASRPASAAPMDHGGDMKAHGTRHHKGKAMHKHGTKAKPASDTPMATESKS